MALVITDQNSPVEAPLARCRKCQKQIDPRSEDDVLDKFGTFIRLRCTNADCDHIDWYKGVALAPRSARASAGSEPADEPGEVWIHDVILGLSFRTDNDSNHDLA
jgi:hypothetical protein